jgi:hypothetical protein
MPEPALHFSVIFAVSAPRLGVKRALLLSLLALLPDLDVLIHIHRSMSHSIILLILTWIPILLVSYLFKHRHLNTALLCLLAVLSHPILDCFQTYTPILYPAYDRSIWVSVNGWLLISPEGFTPQAAVNVKDTPIAFKPFEFFDAPIFTSEGFLISLILTIVPLLLSVEGIRKPVASESKPSSSEAKCFSGFKPASEAWDPASTDTLPSLSQHLLRYAGEIDG